ncbi:MAG: hypothetical protein MJ231_09035, partial [bacterium]|nr:hypothetical protein [bacterium]
CGNIAALFLYIVSVFFIGISIQSIVPYSDAYGFIVCSFILFTFVCIRNKYLKYILISIFSVIGYFIKPTVLAVTVAIIVVKLISFIRCARTNSIKEIFNSKIVQLKTYIKIIILCIVSVLIL